MGDSIAGYVVFGPNGLCCFEHIDLSPENPRILLLTGEAPALFGTQTGAFNAVRATVDYFRSEGDKVSLGDYRIIPLPYADAD